MVSSKEKDFSKLLDVKNLNVSFKIDAGRVLAVNGVSLSLDKGKVLGIVGESGSGKSVTAYSIMGILDKNGRIDSGKINYYGTDLLKLSEKERQDIRGNKISIIFQDAMVSLNPVYSIGNQLREAILTHAKDPLETAIYPYENAVRSDEQRIAAMKRGLAKHPEREELKKDLEAVSVKLEQDKQNLAKIKLEAKENYDKLVAEKKAEYKAKLPELNKAIKEARKLYRRDFFRLEVKPSFDEVDKLPSVKDAKGKIATTKEAYDRNVQALEWVYENRNPEDKKDKEKVAIFKDSVRRHKNLVRDSADEYQKARHDFKTIVHKYCNSVVYKHRIDAWNGLKAAKKAKNNFYWECRSAYEETKYSANKKALEMLIEVGITEPEKRLKQYPFELSGGMLQRCMIAMALVQKPDILIADEPTTALDVTIQAQILDLLKKLQKEYGMAIIIITHDLGVVAQICDEVDIMYAGRIVERGTVDDIFYNPQHEYTKGLLNSMPKLDSDKKRLEPIAGNPVDLFCLPKGCAFSSRCKSCMKICIDQYPEEIKCDESGHAASCWAMVKRLHDEKKIDVVKGNPEGKPLIYNGAIIAEEKKNHKHSHKKDNKAVNDAGKDVKDEKVEESK